MALAPSLSKSELLAALEAAEVRARAQARRSFWAYRQYKNPQIKKGWFTREISYALQDFYNDYVAGLRPKLALMAPPQHGKSAAVTDFLEWFAGKRPDDKQMYASFSEALSTRANMTLQRTFDSPRYQALFPETRINSENIVTIAGRYQRNRSMLEFVNKRGSFRNTTVGGPINGEGLDLGAIDDPIKGREEAHSKTVRDKVWEWFTDDYFGRFSEYAGFIAIMTRWHVDDPLGRMVAAFPEMRVIRFPAIATEDEEFRKKGEPLFPEHKSLEFLMERKGVLTQAGWESVYQQNPIVVGGGLFPVEKFTIIPQQPAPQDVRKAIRYWDKAATKDGGAYTCGTLMLMLKDGRFVVSDVRRKQWSAMEREQVMRSTAEADTAMWSGRGGPMVHIWIEQEPGSGGKESAERSIMNLRGFVAKADRVTGDKETRADPYAAQVQGGNVYLVAADWNMPFIDEHEAFPSSKYKDQVDSAAGAFAKLAIGSRYDSSLAWVG